MDLRGNDLGPEGAKAIAPAIRDSRSLASIDLSRNQLFPQDEVPVDKLMGTSFSVGAEVTIEGYEGKLYVLKEESDGKITVGDPTGIKAIADAMRVSHSMASVE